MKFIDEKKMHWFVNKLVKFFLFPLFIVGILLRVYDKYIKKESKKKRVSYDIWY